MKPLFRWTVGGVSEAGFDLLKLSVRRVQRLYGDRFDYLVCYNNLSAEQQSFVNSIGVETLRQAEAGGSVIPFTEEMWKLQPPRLRPEAHEIVMDNDIVLTHKLPHLDDFLGTDQFCLMTKDVVRFYGDYEHLVPADVYLNCGLYGMPPGFDLAAEVRRVVQRDNAMRFTKRKHVWGNDQGILAAIFSKRKYIPVSTIWVRLLEATDDYLPGESGAHFLGANRFDYHRAWEAYRSKITRFF